MALFHDKCRQATRVKLISGDTGASNCHASSQRGLALNYLRLDRANKLASQQPKSNLQSFPLLDREFRKLTARKEMSTDGVNRRQQVRMNDMAAASDQKHQLKVHRSSPPAPKIPSSRSPLKCSSLLLPVLVSVLFVLGSLSLQLAPVLGSPPVDYFIYTSQVMSAPAGAQNVTSMLPTIRDIYTARPRNGTGGTTSASASASDDRTEELKLADQMAARVMTLVGNSSHEHDNNMADLEATRFAWNLMERQALLYMRNRIASLKPFIMELLGEAQVSGQCLGAIEAWLEQLGDLKQWATLMWNSWGQFPMAGVFEGSYTDLGSYGGCMRIGDNELIGQAQYCMLDFQPIVPARPRFHSIFKRILDYNPASQQLTNGDFDEALASLMASHPSDARQLIGSHATAHAIASSRYKDLHRKSYGNYGQSGEREANDKRLSDNDSTGSYSRYNKRTIEQGSLAAAAAAATTNATREAPSGLSMEALAASSAPDGSNLNLTLKAEALIEMALKAQYFYYVKFRMGACLPSKCSKQDVSQLARVAGQRAILQSVEVNCMKKEPFSVNTYQLVAISILTTLALIAVLGGIVDLLGYKENLENSSAFINWLLPFSIWTNAKRLFDLDTAGTHGDLECVHGLRFFSMIWVIYGHTILYMEYQSFTHFYDVIETQIPSFLLLPSLNANFSVDTFFVISGILTTYVTWEYTKGDARKFNKFAFLISRYIRLTPQLAIVILCFFLLPLTGDGPMFRQVADDKAQVCHKNWAINLLYLQSYINSDKLCIDPSWWLSIEMTFHVVSVLVIIVMINNVRSGMIVNFVVASVFTLWGAVIHYSHGFAIQYLPSIPQRYEVSAEQTQLFFHRPYPHAASYFIGIALGYVLANRTVKKLSAAQVSQGWLVCALGLIVSLWGSYYWNLGAPYTQLQATLYYNVCQVLWPISIAWIILACSLGHGGFVNSVLSARVFVPLGRVTYMTYLSHALIIYYHSARMNITLEPSMLLFTYLFIANTTLALALGVVLTVVYESPILNLQKQLFTYLTQKFDPTIRESRCKPTRLDAPSAAKLANGLLTTKARSVGELLGTAQQATIGGATIIIDEQNALLKGHQQADSQQHQSNGFYPSHYNLTTRKTMGSSSPAANCLLLDADNYKQKALVPDQCRDGGDPTQKDDHGCNGV